ncbi:hypothetical protein WR25_19264 isoform B [Diploscapter pachys]|uniref:Fungal lipase-type domain-containing protein n=1 Tax=Diploscapter pachys TaxID=2018661 RepID=A0A2A2L7T7_9BILA|nr:hypothetical protein WR25_19264 isoform B [Diploscapter pachys]
MTPLIAAGYAPKGPQDCLKNQAATVQFYKDANVTCFPEGPETTCYAYTAFDSSKKVIILSFRGTTTLLQTIEEIEEYFKHKTPFFDHGFVFKYFYDGFMDLWNAGIESQVRSLKYNYPDYSIWV